MEKHDVVRETAELMVRVAGKIGILDTINEIFDVGDAKPTGLYLTIPMTKEVLEIDVTKQDFPQRLSNALNGWSERIDDRTVHGAFPLLTCDIQTREKIKGLGKMSLDTLKTWVIEKAWEHMNDHQRMEFCENLLSLNTYYIGGNGRVE